MAIYAIKSPEDDETKGELYDFLKRGEGRFGWSWIPTADLRELEKKLLMMDGIA